MHGVVSEWDDEAGLGTVTDDDGTAYALHCTQIADGTRTIAPGTAVRFTTRPKLGRWEATDVAPA